MATLIGVGSTIVHSTKEEQDCTLFNRFSGIKQEVIFRKPFPIPKISTVLQELEGFTYATALDLNMCYIIRKHWILTYPTYRPTLGIQQNFRIKIAQD